MRPLLRLPFAQGLDATWSISAPATALPSDRSCCVGRDSHPRWCWEGGELPPACPSTGTEERPLLSLSQTEEDFMASYRPFTETAAAGRTGRGTATSAMPARPLCLLCPSLARLCFRSAAAQQQLYDTPEEKENKKAKFRDAFLAAVCSHAPICGGVAEKNPNGSMTFLLWVTMQSINPDVAPASGWCPARRDDTLHQAQLAGPAAIQAQLLQLDPSLAATPGMPTSGTKAAHAASVQGSPDRARMPHASL